MCGIFGFVSKNLSNPVEFWNFADTLFIATQSRGRDASGFAAMADGAFVTEKAPMDAEEFVGRSKLWRNLRDSRKVSLVGHTRAATHGSPSKNTNNHPFHGPRFSIVHNGGVFGHEQVAKRNGFKLATECDSELILHFMEQGTTATDGSKRALESLDRIAMMAVATLDRTDGSVYLWRTNDAPCVVLFIKRYNAYVFASTPAIINETLHRMPGTDKLIETIVNPFDGQPLPPYHAVQLTPDGKLNDRPLACNFVTYSTQNQATRVLGGYAATFAGALADTTTSINKCIICDDPLSSTGKDVVRLGAGEYACKSCISKIMANTAKKEEDDIVSLSDAADQKDVIVASGDVETNPTPAPSKEPTLVTLDAEHILDTVLPQTTGTRDLSSRDGRSNTVSCVASYRARPDDYDLTEWDAMEYMNLNSKSIDEKMNYWSGMGWSRITKMTDGEYYAYFRFIEEMV